MLDTSGVWVEENEDGTIELGYVDFGVEQFGGHDFEWECKFDKENAEKFRAELNKSYHGSLQEQVVAAFGERFSNSKFYEFCGVRGLKFKEFTWS